MNNRIYKNLNIVSANIFFIAILVFCVFSLYYLGLQKEYLIMSICTICVVLFPILDLYIEIIERKSHNTVHPEDYINTIDELLNTDTFEDFISNRFYRILELVSADHGILAIYDQVMDEFKIFQHQIGTDKFPINSRFKLLKSNILCEVTKSRDDILIKEKLNTDINLNKKIYDEMTKFNADVIIPIFYLDIFMGLLFLGENKSKIDTDLIFSLKIFATKIASISINSFFWQEMAKKNELEKEKHLGIKVQKSFLPSRHKIFKTIETSVYYSTQKAVSNKFYDIYEDRDHLNVTAYGSKSPESDSLIFMPSIKAMLETLSRLNYSPEMSVEKMNKMKILKAVFDDDFNIMHSFIFTNGQINFFKIGFPDPFIYNKSNIYQIKSSSFEIDTHETLILCNNNIEPVIHDNIKQISKIIDETSNLKECSKRIVHLVKQKEKIRNYKFLSLVRIKDIEE